MNEIKCTKPIDLNDKKRKRLILEGITIYAYVDYPTEEKAERKNCKITLN